MRLKLFSLFAVLLSFGQAARADTITATLGPVYGLNSQTFGTFTFVIPTGATIVSAVLTVGGVFQTFSSGENIYLNDVYLGRTSLSVPASDMSFTITDFATLMGGSATLRDTLSYQSGSFNFSTSGETLTIVTTGGTAAVTPEPSSIALLGTGLLSIAAMMRKRSV